jgi:hypothetical protein
MLSATSFVSWWRLNDKSWGIFDIVIFDEQKGNSAVCGCVRQQPEQEHGGPQGANARRVQYMLVWNRNHGSLAGSFN